MRQPPFKKENPEQGIYTHKDVYAQTEQENQELKEWRDWGEEVITHLREKMIPRPPMQQEFNTMIGELDRLISMMVECGKTPLDMFNQRTLKHHAEDMILAGRKILKDLGEEEPDHGR